MIDVVRLLKNQELFEIQRANEEGREPRVYHGVFSSHPDNDTRLKEVVASAGKVARVEQRPTTATLSDPNHGTAGRCERSPGRHPGHALLSCTHGLYGRLSVRMARAEPAHQAGRRYSPEGRDAATLHDALPAGHDPRAVPGAESQGNANERGEPLEVNGLPGYTAMAQNVSLPWLTSGPRRDTRSST